MEQPTSHIRIGDLVAVQRGYSKRVVIAVFIRNTGRSIQYIPLSYLSKDYISTANSDYRRIWKLTMDNLNEEEKKLYDSTINSKIYIEEVETEALKLIKHGIQQQQKVEDHTAGIAAI
jgi:hypothetical protein